MGNVVIAPRAWQKHGGQAWKRDIKDAGRKWLCLAPGMGLGIILAPIRWKGWTQGRQGESERAEFSNCVMVPWATSDGNVKSSRQTIVARCQGRLKEDMICGSNNIKEHIWFYE